MLTRRELIRGAATTVAFLGVSGQASATEDSLRARAAASGLIYGCATKSSLLKRDPSYAQALIRDAGILAPEWELKRTAVQPKEGRWDFSGFDYVAAFGHMHNMKLRGHTFVWYTENPPWLEQALAERPSENLLTDYVFEGGKRYRGHMHSWDVVNEAIEPDQGDVAGLRINSPWYKAFGPRYIDLAFQAAREADPNCLLFYNDYSTEMDCAIDERRRTAVLKLLENLKSRNVPIDGFGMQSHLKPFQYGLDQRILARFVQEIHGMGLKILITELDVADIGGPQRIAIRDAQIGSVTKNFLDVVLQNPSTLGVLTWGISDKYSWLSTYPAYKWPNGQLSRGLPLDASFRRKPMWDAIASAFDARR